MKGMEYWIRLLCLIICVTQLSCRNSAGSDNNSKLSKGVNIAMNSYNLGRFSINIPAEMKFMTLSQKLRECEVQEFPWQQIGDREGDRMTVWNAQIAKIEKQELPRGISNAIIDIRQIKDVGKFAKGVFYYGDDISTNMGHWYILIDTGSTGISLHYWGSIREKEEMFKWVLDIAKAYRSQDTKSTSVAKSFNLRHGAILLPYYAQESTFAMFEEHPLELKLELEMNETHVDEPKDEGLLARTAAVIATGYATGVKIHRIRSKKRAVAGLDGEEEVDRMSDKYRTAISFGWRYAGRKNSGEYPEVVIRMESPDGNLEEKLKVWDAILDSMRPLYKQ